MLYSSKVGMLQLLPEEGTLFALYCSAGEINSETAGSSLCKYSFAEVGCME